MMKPKNNLKQLKSKNLIFIMVPLTLIAVLCGIFLPGIILTGSSNKALNENRTAPSEYYSGVSSAVARNASSQLSDYQKMNLISGIWDSSTQEASIAESNISDYEAVTLAKDGLENLYKQELYPVSLQNSYGNWYSWSTELYKAVDTTFNTYTVYYWIIRFTRYDDSETHTVLMTEEGRILFVHAYTNDKMPDFKYDINNHISGIFPTARKQYSLISGDTISQPEEKINPYPNIDYSNLPYTGIYYFLIGASDAKTVGKFKEYALAESNDDMEFYYIYTCSTDHDFALSIVPYSY